MATKTVKIDKFDRKILYELDKDGRASIPKIAKEIGRSKDFVFYRIKRMKKQGIYMYDIISLDTSKLGFQTYLLYIQISNTLRLDEVIDHLSKTPQISGIDKIIGMYQLFTAVYVKNVTELENIIMDLGKKFGANINSYRLLLLYKGFSTAHNYLFSKKEFIRHTKVRFASTNVVLSNREKQILEILIKNPTISFSQIAERINSSLPTIRQTYNDLVKKEIIHYIRPSIDSTKLDYIHRHVLIGLKFGAMKNLDKIKEYLLGLRSTKALHLTLGEFDIAGRFIFKDLAEFNKFKEDFYAKFGDYVQAFMNDDYFEEINYKPQGAIRLFEETK